MCDGTDAFPRKVLDGFYAIGNARYLHHNMRIEGCQFLTFPDHSFVISCNHLGTDITLYDIAYLHVMSSLIFDTFNAFFRHQRRVGGHSVQNSQIMCFPDLIQVSCINKEFLTY